MGNLSVKILRGVWGELVRFIKKSSHELHTNNLIRNVCFPYELLSRRCIYTILGLLGLPSLLDLLGWLGWLSWWAGLAG